MNTNSDTLCKNTQERHRNGEQEVSDRKSENIKKMLKFSVERILEDDQHFKPHNNFQLNQDMNAYIDSRSVVSHTSSAQPKYMDSYYLSQCIAVNNPMVSPYNYEWYTYRNSLGPYPTDSYASHHNTLHSLYNHSNVRNSDQSANQSAKRKNSGRAVFHSLQRKGLEKRFQKQKYITKPERQNLAQSLNLSDSQVKMTVYNNSECLYWPQNRRMKWRHSKEFKDDIKQTSNREQQLITSFPTNKANEVTDKTQTI
ncbi:unnamed protein product [Oppiella nova]|uniref:Homeobox domain-containing protein n=1 Tax=Oppiella nova TaxID=334625 RepID=A0A7R9QBJ3_9ACAR|nr:unnamed protein product [Oppiella nova]CAG2161939.1 unnamed protein product [Oppiella nova]